MKYIYLVFGPTETVLPCPILIYFTYLTCFNTVKCKGKFVPLLLTEHHAMRAYFLTSALDGGEWPASCPGCLTPTERAPAIHWIRGWVSPRAVLDAVVKRKIPSLHRESNHRTPIVQSVAQRYTDHSPPEKLVVTLIQKQFLCQ